MIQHYDFGKSFIGPMLQLYVSEVSKRLTDGKQAIALAREGHFIAQALRQIIPNDKVIYLKVSRAILFRVSVDEDVTYQWSLKPKFDGTFSDLLRYRFGFSNLFVDENISVSERNIQICLPEDLSKASKLLKQYSPVLSREISESKASYLSYLSSLDISDGDLVLDLGYGGTIQKLLTFLLRKSTEGLYFIASEASEHPIESNFAKMSGVFAEDVQMGDGCLMLDRSMFLESLLTAPEGQLKDIRKNPITGEFEFFYGKRANTQKHFHELEQVFEGAIDHVKHCFKHDISYSKEEIHHLFNQFVTKRSMFPAITWKLFEIDDAVSGNGNVDPLAFFGL